jgi:hypothetical protein
MTKSAYSPDIILISIYLNPIVIFDRISHPDHTRCHIRALRSPLAADQLFLLPHVLGEIWNYSSKLLNLILVDIVAHAPATRLVLGLPAAEITVARGFDVLVDTGAGNVFVVRVRVRGADSFVSESFVESLVFVAILFQLDVLLDDLFVGGICVLGRAFELFNFALESYNVVLGCHWLASSSLDSLAHWCLGFREGVSRCGHSSSHACRVGWRYRVRRAGG